MQKSQPFSRNNSHMQHYKYHDMYRIHNIKINIEMVLIFL
jgi:hypothetical protein